MDNFDLSAHEITVTQVVRNAAPARLYEDAVKHEGAVIAANGALIIRSGKKTGRSPLDKRLVEHPDSSGNVWWGPVNFKLDEHVFLINRQRAIDYLNTRDELYVLDGYAGWDARYQLNIRVICSRAYHALFMHNMLIRPTEAQLADFGTPDYVIYNAGQFPANPHTHQMTSRTSIDLSLERREFVILGTEYAGEMKKGVFTLMHWLMPSQDVLSMHCSANAGPAGDVTLFFGLSGTGKTTLSADPRRRLIGDDEHCWSAEGIFNVEGGCYAKCSNLSALKEPEIFQAVRFGTVLENTAFDPHTRQVDYADLSITENTRAAYPIEFIPNAVIPCMGGHPANIIFLTCDASGVLPPVSRLSPAQAMYHFISGYTARVAGTEMGVKEPQPTFSACFSAAFLVRHPTVYAELLAAKMRTHGAQAWLINTGWSGGPYGIGRRMQLDYTRALIDAIHSGALAQVATRTDPTFGVGVPTECPGIPADILWPKNTWTDPSAYDAAASRLAGFFQENFKKYSDVASDEIKNAGPVV
ncbi:MAG: phosphoenolpyruvate carboxykinase (ATP) [Pirellulales bacterium]|nr:phosphoenolpyruvate carboxykinase (ATP) [Pirellulales bacterium]